jgi:hypothetical protein
VEIIPFNSILGTKIKLNIDKYAEIFADLQSYFQCYSATH